MIAVALESRGADAARPYIESASPGYPCLIDVDHEVARLYNMINVPQAVWIDERGQIVRPTETAGVTDGFRKMDTTTYAIPKPELDEMMTARRRYLDSIRDWVTYGVREQIRARRRRGTPPHAEIHARGRARTRDVPTRPLSR